MMAMPVGQKTLNNVKRVYSYPDHYLKEMDANFKISEKERSRKKGEKPPMVREF